MSPAPGPGMGPGLSGFVGVSSPGRVGIKTHTATMQAAYERAGGGGDYRSVGSRSTARTRRPGVTEPSRQVMEAGLGAGALARIIPPAMRFMQRAWPYIAGGVAGMSVAEQFGDVPAGAGGGGAFPQQYGGGSIPFEGPGLREPSADYLVKEWHRRIDSKDGDFTLQYYLTMSRRGTYRIFMYNTKTGMWKSWGMPKPAVIGKNLPSHKMITRLRRNLKRHTADAKTILMLTSPTAYAKQLGYRKYSRRRR